MGEGERITGIKQLSQLQRRKDERMEQLSRDSFTLSILTNHCILSLRQILQFCVYYKDGLYLCLTPF